MVVSFGEAPRWWRNKWLVWCKDFWWRFCSFDSLAAVCQLGRVGLIDWMRFPSHELWLGGFGFGPALHESALGDFWWCDQLTWLSGLASGCWDWLNLCDSLDVVSLIDWMRFPSHEFWFGEIGFGSALHESGLLVSESSFGDWLNLFFQGGPLPLRCRTEVDEWPVFFAGPFFIPMACCLLMLGPKWYEEPRTS